MSKMNLFLNSYRSTKLKVRKLYSQFNCGYILLDITYSKGIQLISYFVNFDDVGKSPSVALCLILVIQN
jgi:hypothetical protein